MICIYSHIFYFRLVQYARCCSTIWNFILRICKFLLKYWHRVTDIIRFVKRLKSSLDLFLNYYQNLVQFRFKNIFQREFSNRSCMVI